MMSDELKPCPFCGGEAQVQHDYERGEYRVLCFGDKCNLVPSTFFFEKKSRAISAWNTRIPDLSRLDALADEWAAEMDGKGLAGTKVKDYWYERLDYWEAQ